MAYSYPGMLKVKINLPACLSNMPRNSILWVGIKLHTFLTLVLQRLSGQLHALATILLVTAPFPHSGASVADMVHGSRDRKSLSLLHITIHFTDRYSSSHPEALLSYNFLKVYIDLCNLIFNMPMINDIGLFKTSISKKNINNVLNVSHQKCSIKHTVHTTKNIFSLSDTTFLLNYLSVLPWNLCLKCDWIKSKFQKSPLLGHVTAFF
jgi:hypothetical protein